MIDAGDGHYFLTLTHPCKGGANAPLGYMWLHFAPNGSPCSGVVRTCTDHKDIADEGVEYWDEKTALTLTPSLLCKRCNLHGFLVDGKWKDAGSPTRTNIVQLFAREAWREMSKYG